MSNTITVNAEFISKLARARIGRSFIGGYFGTREAGLFLKDKDFMRAIGKNRPFFDITAGTGQFPFALAKMGRKVFVSDICPYAAAICQLWARPSLTGGSMDRFEWLVSLAKFLDPKERERCRGKQEGFLYHNMPHDRMAISTAHYLDSVARDGTPLSQWLVAKAVSGYTFRNRHSLTDKNSRGVSNLSITPWDLYPQMLRWAMRARACREQLDVETWARNLDSLGGIAAAPFPEGTTVYMDTAWPYNEKAASQANPYRVFVELHSSAMLQKQLKAKHLWERTTPVQQILDDVSMYIDLAFAKGAGQFVVCTQDTNYPDPHQVFAYFGKRYKLKETITVKDYSNAANKDYKNYWCFLEPK